MIASKNHGGRKAASQNDSNKAIGDNMVAPKTGSTDQKDTGELVNNISESRTAPPTRRSSPHTSPLCARLGDAAGKKDEATPDGRGEMAKELTKKSAQHDDGGGAEESGAGGGGAGGGGARGPSDRD